MTTIGGPIKLAESLQGSSFLARRLSVIISAFLVFFVTGWGVVFAYADRTFSVTPAASSVINENQPVISVALGTFPGLRLRSASVVLDGKKITSGVELTPAVIKLRPTERLSEGIHRLRFQLSYTLLASKKITRTWKFKVDTVPPEISVGDDSGSLVTDRDDILVSGNAESGARVKYKYNKAAVAQAAVTRSGAFKIPLKKLGKKNRLLITVEDEAGNLSSRAVSVIRDRDNPELKSFSPGEGEIVRSPNPKVTVEVTDAGSLVRQTRLFIDGRPAVGSEGAAAGKVTYLGALLGDGPHTASVEATDMAGHTVKKEWSFTVDSRRIVVDRRAFKLFFYRNGGLFKVYSVAVGMPRYPTPVGAFKIISKRRNPIWLNPGSAWAKNMPRVIPAGPGNPLGTRAIGINARAIFIHGTYDARSIGRAASHGCVRMYIRDSEELFEMVDIGVPVDIIN